MITTKGDVEQTLLQIAQEMSDAGWQEKSNGLMFPIGFFGSQGSVAWGFLQMPHYHAFLHHLVECNLHIFPDGVKNATEKIVMRDFLNSEDGAELRTKYGEIKMEMESKIAAGNVVVADYNKGKNEVIQEILVAAEKWETAERKLGG